MSDAERLEILKRWVASREAAIHQIGVVKHAVLLLENTVTTADKGLRQQQSAGLDEVLSDLHNVCTMLASIQHKLDEPPPA